MSTKTVAVDSVGAVTLQRRKNSRSIRIRIANNGKIVVTYPWFVPQKAALEFVKTNTPWIHEEKRKRSTHLEDGLIIGRIHKLRFVHDASLDRPRVRVTATQVIVTTNLPFEDPLSQSAAFDGAVRALKREAAHFLPKRLKDIADSEGYTYTSSSTRQLKGRWGSCTNRQHITLNCYLMQLPIELIDYVIFHELAHTRAMNHGKDFWAELESHLPNARVLQKEIKQYQPTIPARTMA